MALSPAQQVKKHFESKEKLVSKLAETADQLGGDSKDQTKSRLRGLSNQKLLRLWRVEQTVRERFGDRAKLIAHIVEVRSKAGHTADAAFKAKLETYPKARLLDMTRQKLGERPAKQTPEEKMKKKRGRKQRERAQSKS